MADAVPEGVCKAGDVNIVASARNRAGNSARWVTHSLGPPAWLSELPADVPPPKPAWQRLPGDVPVFWYRSFTFTNFGDELSWVIIGKLTGRRVVWSPLRRTCLVGVGSVLGWLSRERPLRGSPALRTVWGSGLMAAQPPGRLSHTRIHAVRGTRTLDLLEPQDRLHVSAVGDPALLMSRLFPVADVVQRQPVLALHYMDVDPQFVAEVRRAIPDVQVIDVQQGPLAVSAALARASVVITSGLHPLVIADSYGVPSIRLASDALPGDGVKFDDYVSAFDGVDNSVSREALLAAGSHYADLARVPISPQRLSAIQDDLLAAFTTAHGVGLGLSATPSWP